MSIVKFNDFKDALAAAYAARQNKDFAGAAEIYRGLPTAYPGKKHAVVRAAEGLKLCGHWSEAVSLLLTALERHPISPMYLTNLAEAYAGIGESAKAAECLRRCLENNPGQPPLLWKRLGDLYAHAGSLADAVESYGQLLEREPLSVDGVLRRGDAFLALERIDDALVDYRRAEAIQPNNAEVLSKIGAVTLEYGGPREAAGYLQRALAADPRSPSTYANLSLALSVLGVFDDAARVASQGLEFDAGTPLGKFALGTALIGLEQFESAAEELRAAAAAAPRNARILSALADAETAREDFLAAELALQQIITVDSANIRARFMLAALHGEAVESAPPEVAADYFDLLAARYDHHAVPRRHYDLPAAAAAMLEEALPDQREFRRVLDLGCGTGLVVAALRDAFRVEMASGIDIAPRMIDIAAQKNLYDRLIVGEAVPTMENLGESFDLITAVELAPYLGNLSALVTTAHACLAPNGLFLCSIEVSNRTTRELMRGGRYAHGLDHVEDLARATGLEVLDRRERPLHRTAGAQTTGALVLFRRR